MVRDFVPHRPTLAFKPDSRLAVSRAFSLPMRRAVEGETLAWCIPRNTEHCPHLFPLATAAAQESIRKLAYGVRHPSTSRSYNQWHDEVSCNPPQPAATRRRCSTLSGMYTTPHVERATLQKGQPAFGLHRDPSPLSQPRGCLLPCTGKQPKNQAFSFIYRVPAPMTLSHRSATSCATLIGIGQVHLAPFPRPLL